MSPPADPPTDAAAARPAPKSPIAPTIHDELTTHGEAPPRKPEPASTTPTVHDEPTTIGGAPPRKPDTKPTTPSDTPPPPTSSTSSTSNSSSNIFQRRARSEAQGDVDRLPRDPHAVRDPGRRSRPADRRKPSPAIRRSRDRSSRAARGRRLRRSGRVTRRRSRRFRSYARPRRHRPPAVDAEDEKTDLVSVPVDPIASLVDSGPVYARPRCPRKFPSRRSMCSCRRGAAPAACARRRSWPRFPPSDWTMSPDASVPTRCCLGRAKSWSRRSRRRPPAAAEVHRRATGRSRSIPKPDGASPRRSCPRLRRGRGCRWQSRSRRGERQADSPRSSGTRSRPASANPKIEIDPTLMEPFKPMPAANDDDAPRRCRPTPRPGPSCRHHRSRRCRRDCPRRMCSVHRCRARVPRRTCSRSNRPVPTSITSRRTSIRSRPTTSDRRGTAPSQHAQEDDHDRDRRGRRRDRGLRPRARPDAPASRRSQEATGRRQRPAPPPSRPGSNADARLRHRWLERRDRRSGSDVETGSNVPAGSGSADVAVVATGSPAVPSAARYDNAEPRERTLQGHDLELAAGRRRARRREQARHDAGNVRAAVRCRSQADAQEVAVPRTPRERSPQPPARRTRSS